MRLIMKLFREYYAGHINHDFHLFGEDDIEFLRQFAITDNNNQHIGDRVWKRVHQLCGRA